MRGGGSGRRFSSRDIRVQVMMPRCERRPSHLRQRTVTSCQKRAIASEFPAMPKYP